MVMTTWIAVLLASALSALSAAAETSGGQRAEPDESAQVRGNSEFAFDLYGRLRARDGNVFFSPYSISSALAMTYAGARGPTATEMATVLRFPFEGDRLHRSLAAVTGKVKAAARHADLRVANALWPQAGFPITPDFQSIAQRRYGAGLESLDFRRAPEKARVTINTWVEQQTDDRIKELLPEGVLTPSTGLVLTNAIYFKGVWKHAFLESATRKEKFILSTGQEISDAPLMSQSRSLRYLDGGGFQALELPYTADELSMIVFLPRTVDGLAKLEASLTADRLADWLARMTTQEVDVTLPRFKVTAEFRLDQALADLGMPLAFSAGQADFSGIAKDVPLSLSAVIHKAYVDVNEKGTEAAAATGAVVRVTSALVRPPRPVFRADHPFFFIIRDNGTGSTLFAGRVVNPQAN
jgi:serine protease inhibitor